MKEDAEPAGVETINIDQILDIAINDIWASYDKDNSGSLDKAEVKLLLIDSLVKMGHPHNISEDEFNHAFKTFDEDKNGHVSKAEMKQFLKAYFK